MNFKRYVEASDTWVDSHYIMGTDTDTITTLPAIIYPNDTTVTVGLKGNTVQNGTPSPSLPVDVVGVGELETSGEHAGDYKILISNGGVTTNVYLGDVQTTRNLKKIIITGEEAFVRINSDYTTTGISINGKNWHPALSTTGGFINANNGSKLWIANNAFPDYTTAEAMKEYFAQQYASGNPVVVWYVLASPETGIVNEPLMRIATSSNVYADSVSGITIPVTAGANTISVGTQVQPSEVSVNYKGWHPVADVHEYTNGAWD